MPSRRLPLVTLALILVAPSVARLGPARLLAWVPPQSKDTKAVSEKESSQNREKIKLEEATRVSSDHAVKSAVKEQIKSETGKAKAEAAGGSEVTEFQVEAAKERKPARLEGSKKSAAKNVHGAVYGAAGSSGAERHGGGATGATTKSGKTSVYVESEKSRTANPNPH